jgi:hypothetical protein
MVTPGAALSAFTIMAVPDLPEETMKKGFALIA